MQHEINFQNAEIYPPETFLKPEINFQIVMKGFENYLCAEGKKRILVLLFLTFFA